MNDLKLSTFSKLPAVAPRIVEAVALLRSFAVPADSMTDVHALWAVASVVVDSAPVADTMSRRWVAAPSLPEPMLGRLNHAVERLLEDGMLDAIELTRPSRLAVLAVAVLADPDCKPVLGAAIDQVLQSDGNYVRLRVRIGLPSFTAGDVATANHDGRIDIARHREPRDMVTLANAEYHRRKAAAARGSRITNRHDVDGYLRNAMAGLRRDAATVLEQLRIAA